jgi:hypothetical protein
MTLCIASQRVIPKVSVYFVMTQSGNFWIHSCTCAFHNGSYVISQIRLIIMLKYVRVLMTLVTLCGQTVRPVPFHCLKQ